MLVHHIITRRKLKTVASKKQRHLELVQDPRNHLKVSKAEHDNHHNHSPRLPLSRLPDSVFEFGVEVLGAGRTYNYLRAHYSGEDPRLDALLAD